MTSFPTHTLVSNVVGEDPESGSLKFPRITGGPGIVGDSILSDEGQQCWARFKSDGFDIERSRPEALKVLSDLYEAARSGLLSEVKPGIEPFSEYIVLLKDAVADKKFSSDSLAIIEVIASQTTDVTTARSCVVLIARSLESPHTCEGAIKAFGRVLAHGGEIARAEGEQKLQQMLERKEKRENGDLQEYLAAAVLQAGLGEKDSPNTQHLAAIVFGYREQFARHIESSWDFGAAGQVARSISDQLSHLTSYRHDYDISPTEVPCDNPFESSLVRAMRFLTRSEQELIADCFKSSNCSHIGLLTFAATKGFEAEAATIALHASGFGGSSYNGMFQDGHFHFLFAGGAQVLAARMQNAPVPQSVSLLGEICAEAHYYGNNVHRGAARIAALHLELFKLIDKVPEKAERTKYFAAALPQLAHFFWSLRPVEGNPDGNRRALTTREIARIEHITSSLEDIVRRSSPELTTSNPKLLLTLRREVGCAIGLEERATISPYEEPKPKPEPVPAPVILEAAPQPKPTTPEALKNCNRLVSQFLADPVGYWHQFLELGAELQDAIDAQGPSIISSICDGALNRYLTRLGLPSAVTVPTYGGGSVDISVYEAWERGRASSKLGHTVAAQLRAIAALDAHDSSVVKVLYQQYGILNFARYDTTLLAKQALEPSSKYSAVKPIHLFVSRDDHNGAFFQSRGVDVLQQQTDRDIVVHEFSSPNSLARRLLWARERFGAIANLGIFGHGAHGSLDAPAPIESRHIWSIELDGLIARVAGDPLHVFFGSCHSGDKDGLVDSLALRLKGRSFTIVGATNAHSNYGISYDPVRGFSLKSSEPATHYRGRSSGRLLRSNVPAMA